MWQGKPKWNGKIADINLQGSLLAWNSLLGPVLVLLENCDDLFLPLFQKPEDLHAHMEYLFQRGFPKCDYTIKQIDDPQEFFSSMRGQGVRLMYNPRIINDHHTKWHEVIFEGEEWKFYDAESN